MTEQEAHRLLILASGIDRRVVDDVGVIMWAQTLTEARVTYAQAEQAMVVFHARSSFPVKPADLVAVINEGRKRARDLEHTQDTIAAIEAKRITAVPRPENWAQMVADAAGERCREEQP